MKNLLLVMILAIMSIFAFQSCLAPRVDAALFEPARITWPGVKEDLHRGVFNGVGANEIASSAANLLLMRGDEMEAALDDGDRITLRLVQWSSLVPWVSKGIDAKLEAEEIGPGVAASLREQLVNFNQAIAKLQKP